MVIVKSGEKRTLDEQMRDLEEVQAAKQENVKTYAAIRRKWKAKKERQEQK